MLNFPIKKLLQTTLHVFVKLIKILLWYLGSLMILILVTIIGVLSSCEYQDYKYNKFKTKYAKPFNAVKWQRAFLDAKGQEIHHPSEIYERCYMYKDLITNHLHLYMSYDEITRLLGQPISGSYFRNPELKRIGYTMGNCTQNSLGIDIAEIESILELYFDRKLRVVAISLLSAGSVNGEKFIQSDPKIPVKKAEYLFWCTTKTGYYPTIDCCREHKTYGANPESYHTSFEYCKRDEIKSKWGYEAW